MKPLVSIIVPSFQQARFIGTALDSILSQGYEPLEVLVLDGGSTDGTVAILESYGERIRFRSHPDNGQAAAINEGFRESRGEIVAWLNSDDFYYPGAIRTAVEALASAPECGLVYGEGNQVDEAGRVKWRFPETVPFNLWRLVNQSDYILQPTAFIRRSALLSAGMLEETFNWGLDWDLWIRIAMRFPLCYVDSVLAASRIYGETKTSTGGAKRLRELYRMLSVYGVRGFSPAMTSLLLASLVRLVRRDAEQMTAEQITAVCPSGARGVLGPLAGAGERAFRRWLQNAQGLWPDGLVGRHALLWLPSSGNPGSLEISGENGACAGQRISLRAGMEHAATGPLAPGELFSLSLPVPAGTIPLKAEICATCAGDAPPLDPALGGRQAAFGRFSCRFRPLEAGE